MFRTVTLPLIRKLAGVDDCLELRIISRGAGPGGGGEVMLRVPPVKELPPVKMIDEGMVKRVRGIAHSMKVREGGRGEGGGGGGGGRGGPRGKGEGEEQGRGGGGGGGRGGPRGKAGGWGREREGERERRGTWEREE